MQEQNTTTTPTASQQQVQTVSGKNPNQDKSKRKYIYFCFFLIILLLLCGFFYFGHNTLPSQTSLVAQNTQQPKQNIQTPYSNQITQTKHWIFGNSVAIALNNTIIGKRFIQSINTANTYENGRIKSEGSDPLPNATHIEIFPSYQTIKAAFENNSIPSNVEVIGYDNEHWMQTPLVEQQQPFIYVPLAEQLVHKHGLLFMNTPAADLKQVLDPHAKDQYSGYLDEKLATLARYTDIFEIQAQNAPSVTEYLTFAHQAIAEARASNNKAIILLGITAKTNGPTSQELVQEVQDTRGITDGYWFNIIGGTSGINIALPVLQALSSM